jgi:tetratricopeptide (TPR) repeat protein
MTPSEHTHAHAHSHAKDCGCDHDHDQGSLNLPQRWLVTFFAVGALLILLRPFLVDQMLVRVTSYSADALYGDAVRICKKIIALDGNNVKAWTSLGYAYMDMGQTDMAIAAFEKVLQINPEDRGAASFELGQAYYSQGDYPKAIESFERVRSAGVRAGNFLEADILKYRHGSLGFRSLNSMQTLLGDLRDAYHKTGNAAMATEVQQEYDAYKSKHSKVMF